MANLTTVADLATAAGTLVLAIATFASVRSANTAARTAERAFQVELRPLLFPSHLEDLDQKIRWGDDHWAQLGGGRATIEEDGGIVYLAISLRNVGPGIAVIHSWRVDHWSRRVATPDAPTTTDSVETDPPPTEDFRPHTRDLYVPAGDIGFWQGAIRDDADAARPVTAAALGEGRELVIDLLYGDHEGGQRTISRFLLASGDHEPRDWVVSVLRHWTLDRPDPRP